MSEMMKRMHEHLTTTEEELGGFRAKTEARLDGIFATPLLDRATSSFRQRLVGMLRGS